MQQGNIDQEGTGSKYTYASTIIADKEYSALCSNVLPSYTPAVKHIILSTLYCLQVRASFTTNEVLDWTILHRQLDHITDNKLATMCSNQLLESLPSKFPMNT